ncbi:MAG TPA: family 1 glycosylhydrolase [Acidimicrobiales bacterium]|nr:family 1 glycosylhydrolase [Acidimicrobiales bacterium]
MSADTTKPETVTFPEDFLWGTATAAHQIEGGNVNNDWWQWEHTPGSGCADSSGDACDSFSRWSEDVDLVAGLGLGAYRFSLEWSRIEPAEGEFSAAALDHYRRICARCHERGLSPVVTFHHFTTPLWLTGRGGWEAPDAPDRFARFVTRATAQLGDLIGWACTINEPNVIGVMGYTMGEFPPGVKDDFGRHLAVNDTMVRAHRLAVDALRSGPGRFPVGLTLSMAELKAEEGGEAVRDVAEDVLENTFLRGTEGDDFVGVQCYTRMHFDAQGQAPDDPGVTQTQMGYENWPQVVEYTVRRTADFTGLPVVVTENGIGTDDDAERILYVSEALRGVRRCLDDGIDVRGYFVWSLLDNFEWALGYGPKFGLVAVDRTTFERRPKPSAIWFGEVAKANALVPPA